MLQAGVCCPDAMALAMPDGAGTSVQVSPVVGRQFCSGDHQLVCLWVCIRGSGSSPAWPIPQAAMAPVLSQFFGIDALWSARWTSALRLHQRSASCVQRTSPPALASRHRRAIAVRSRNLPCKHHVPSCSDVVRTDLNAPSFQRLSSGKKETGQFGDLDAMVTLFVSIFERQLFENIHGISGEVEF